MISVGIGDEAIEISVIAVGSEIVEIEYEIDSSFDTICIGLG